MNVQKRIKEAYTRAKVEAHETVLTEDVYSEPYEIVTVDEDLNDGFYIFFNFYMTVTVIPGGYYSPTSYEVEISSVEVEECLVGNDLEFDITELADKYIKQLTP